MIHLGRFNLIEVNGSTGEGFVLMRSDTHKMIGTFSILDADDGNSLGIAEVIKIGETYYMDVFEESKILSILSTKMALGRKCFTTRGMAMNLDRSRVKTYNLSYISLESGKGSNFEVKKYPTIIKADLKCSALLTGNWLQNKRPI